MKSILFCTLLALSAAQGALAQTGPEALFNEGMTAFRSGRFEAALDAFERARAMGMNHPSLYYNMGVSAYRTGRNEQARAHFLKAAAHDRLRQLAHYNLGLVALKTGDTIEAGEWFGRALEGGNEKVRALAATQLERLVQYGEKRFFGVVGANAGFDDNVVDPDATTIGDEGDAFLELLAAGSYLFGSAADGWRLDAGGYLLNYADVDDFNLSAVRLGVARVATFGAWRGELGLSGDRSTLGDTDYLATTSIEVKARRLLDKRTRLLLSYRYDGISALDTSHEYLEGARHIVELGGRRDLGDASIGLAYEYETNEREDLDTGDTFSNYSPVRHGVTLRGEVRVGRDASLSGLASYRVSDYDEPNLLKDGTSVSRYDEQFRFKLRIEGRLAGEWRPFAEFDHSDNESIIDGFDYQRDIVAAGVTWAF